MLLSIITPMYNAAGTIARTIRSLGRIDPANRAQVEALVVDDGSSDGSLATLRQVAPEVSPLKVVALEQVNAGAAAARNHALSHASGRWVCFLDADDELAFDPVPILTAAGGQTCFTFALEYQRDGRVIRRFVPPRVCAATHLDRVTAANPFPTTAVVFRRECIERPLDQTIVCVEDWLFWIQNPRLFERVERRADVVAAIIHMHASNISRQFARAGANRVKVADKVLAESAVQLTIRQRNNLELQRAIGRLQQRLRPPARAFLRLPCAPALYGKFWVYAAANMLGTRASAYR